MTQTQPQTVKNFRYTGKTMPQQPDTRPLRVRRYEARRNQADLSTNYISMIKALSNVNHTRPLDYLCVGCPGGSANAAIVLKHIIEWFTPRGPQRLASAKKMHEGRLWAVRELGELSELLGSRNSARTMARMRSWLAEQGYVTLVRAPWKGRQALHWAVEWDAIHDGLERYLAEFQLDYRGSKLANLAALIKRGIS